MKADGSLNINLQVAGTMTAPEPAGTATLRADRMIVRRSSARDRLSVERASSRPACCSTRLAATWQQAALSAKAELPLDLLAPGT